MTLERQLKIHKTEVKLVVSLYLYLIFILAFFLLFLLFSAGETSAASIDTIKFQGKIVNNSNGTNLNPGSPTCIIAGPTNDTCDFRIEYYSAVTGGTLFATEEFSNIEISEYNGTYSLTLGSGTFTAGSETTFLNVFRNNSSVYYELGFAPLGANIYSEIFLDGVNRPQINSSPYAITAGSVLGGLDTVYANDTDKILNINNVSGLSLISSTAGDIIFGLQSTGDFILNAQSTDAFAFSDQGGFEILLNNTTNPNFTIENQGSSTGLILNETGATTPDLLDLLVASSSRFRITNDGRIESNINGSSQAFNIVYNTNSAISNAIVVSNTGTGIITTAIDVSDPEIENGINLGTNNIQMTDGGTIAINDTLGNQVVQITDSSTNFGGSIESGAVISRNSYTGEEFSRERGDLTVDGNQTWGDYQQFGVDENTVCTFSTVDDVVNGIGRMNVGVAGGSCLTYHSAAAGNAHLQYNMANLPLVIMKVRPSVVSATQDLWVGLGTSAAATTAEPTNGAYFTNNNGNTWTGVTKVGAASTPIVCTGQTISTTQFALLKIETRSTTDVRFYVDNDVSNGVQWVECGTSTTNIYIAGNMTSMIMNAATPLGMNLDIDYYRIWQDDAVEVADQDALGEINITEEDKSETNVNNPNTEVNNIDANAINIDVVDLNDAKDNQNNIDDSENVQTSIKVDSNLTQSENNFINITNTDGFISITSNLPDANTLKLVFDNTLINSDLEISGTVSIGGNLNIQGNITVDGSLTLGKDNFGTIEITEGYTEFLYEFNGDLEYSKDPFVYLTQIEGTPTSFVIEERTTSGFKVRLPSSTDEVLKFEWMVIFKQ